MQLKEEDVKVMLAMGVIVASGDFTNIRTISFQHCLYLLYTTVTYYFKTWTNVS